MRLDLTRDSVAAGDDADAPHRRSADLPDDTSVEALVAWIVNAGYLPRIGGGQATWSFVSRRPFAVAAQQWPLPRMLSSIPFDLEDLNWADGVLRVHAVYHVQQDPQAVFDVLERMVWDAF